MKAADLFAHRHFCPEPVQVFGIDVASFFTSDIGVRA